MRRSLFLRLRDVSALIGSTDRMSRYRGSRFATAWLLVAIIPSVVLAQSSGGPYRIRKQTIAAGVVATGGNFRLVGTLAQAVVGPRDGGAYRVSGGFHFAQGAEVSAARLFCDGFEDGPCP